MACGWAEVQMDLDGSKQPWYGVAGNMPIELKFRELTRALQAGRAG